MYDGRIYEIGNKYALKLEAGTFHYAQPSLIEEAFNAGFELCWEEGGRFNKMEETPEEFIKFITV